MKIYLFILLLFFQTVYAFAQKIASIEIKYAITKEFNKWLAKGKFETNAEYQVRVQQGKAEEQLKTITENVIKDIKSSYCRRLIKGVLGTYDAENESFVLTNISNTNDNELGDFAMTIKVPRTIARTLDSAAARVPKVNASFYLFESFIRILPQEMVIINDKWTISKALIIFKIDYSMSVYDCFYGNTEISIKIIENVVWLHCGYNYKFEVKDISTLVEKKKKKDPRPNIVYYDWDLSQQINYNPSSITPVTFNFSDLNIVIPNQTVSTASAKPQVPDLDMNSIQTKNKNPNAFAVVIGNKDYQYTKKVSFALNDAQTIKKYLINVLGYSEGNIFYLENASKSNFETYFGTKENPQGKLFNNIKQGISDVFIYYAGHGAPGLKDNKGYFVPIDCDPQYVEQGGYSLDLFYNNISKLNAKSITVVTDACFSGAEIFNNISPIIITVSNPIAIADNCVILSSSTGSQVSSWYNDKQHGMFTYFFLKALQDKDKSDKNKDSKLSFQEIFDYVSDKTEGVPYYARSIHGVDQTPAIQGTGVKNIFIEYK